MSGPLKHLLVVDDDQRLRALLLRYLRGEGFNVSTVKSVAEARAALRLFIFDLIILDIMMPQEKGFVLLEENTKGESQNCGPPILFLSAMGGAGDRVHGLKLGAEDYLVKPFDPQELVLRVHLILRRTTVASPASLFVFGAVSFDPARDHLTRGTTPIPLTFSELNLLKIFILYLGEPLERRFLAEALGEHLNVRTVDVQVNRLRQKIEENPKIPRYLQTIRGQGYRLRTDPW